jgi:hypothetical protein
MLKIKKFSIFFIAFLIISASFSSFSKSEENLSLDKETINTVIEKLPDYYSTFSQMSEEDLEKAKKKFEGILAEKNLSFEDFQPLAQEAINSLNALGTQQQGTLEGFDINSLSSMIPQESLNQTGATQEHMPQLQEIMQQFLDDEQ